MEWPFELHPTHGKTRGTLMSLSLPKVINDLSRTISTPENYKFMIRVPNVAVNKEIGGNKQWEHRKLYLDSL